MRKLLGLVLAVCFSLPAWRAGFDSPLRSVAWAAMSEGARAAVVLGCVVIPAALLCLLVAGGRKERRLGLALLGVLALLWGSYARLAGTVWYVRPIAECAFNGNGTAPGCAASGGAAGAWRGTANVAWGSIAAGDTLAVSGAFIGAAETDVSGITLRVDTSGSSASARVTVDCDFDDDGVKAVLDGAGEVGIGIRTAIVGTSQTTWTRVRDCKLRRYTNKAVVTYNVTGDATNDANQIWEGMEIGEHGDGGTADNCFDSRGRYITLNDSYIDGCDEDAVYHQGKYFRSDGLTTRNFSRVNSNGDGLQLAGEFDGYWVSHYDCEHGRDTKQCFIASVASDTGAGGILEDFSARCMPGATVTNCVFATGVGATIRRGFISGGNYGLAIEGSANSAGMVVASIIQRGATIDGISIFTGAGAGNSIRNVIASKNGRHGIFLATTAAGTVTNAVATGNAGCGINRADAGQTESYNDAHDNGVNFCSGSVSTTAGTGSFSLDPAFIGGPNPTTPVGFRLKYESVLRTGGTCYLATGCAYPDFAGRRHRNPPAIGAWAVGEGDQRD